MPSQKNRRNVIDVLYEFIESDTEIVDKRRIDDYAFSFCICHNNAAKAMVLVEQKLDRVYYRLRVAQKLDTTGDPQQQLTALKKLVKNVKGPLGFDLKEHRDGQTGTVVDVPFISYSDAIVQNDQRAIDEGLHRELFVKAHLLIESYIKELLGRSSGGASIGGTASAAAD